MGDLPFSTMNRSIDFEKLISFGTKAPSGHNTQPWLFSTGKKEIHIHPDFTRALPVVDSDNHALYISLGCAAENIVIAAKKFGLDPTVSLLKVGNGNYAIKIALVPAESMQEDNLFDFIDQRQSTRTEYSQKPVPSSEQGAVKQSFEFEGIDLLTFTKPDEIKTLAPLIIKGSNRQFQNQKFVGELVDWFRFSKAEALQKGDGLWLRCMGLPNMPRFIGNIVMKYFVSAKSEAKRWEKLIETSAGFALFVVKKNDVPHWIRLGRGFQRFGLTATKLGISHAHVNMPCEEPDVRQKLVKHLNLGTKQPLLLIRFGYSDKMPYSFRRDINDVKIEEREANYG